MEASITVTVNGQEHALPTMASVAALLTRLGLDGRKVAVERNLAIVPRSIWASTPLADGDALEIVAFIGGG